MRHFLFCLLFIVAVAAPALAERRTEQTKRANPVGDGIEEAPLMTLSWDPTIQIGQTELIQVAVADHDGNPVTVEYYVNGEFKFKQPFPPYGVSIGPDIATPPYTVTVIAEDDYGNKSRARLLIRLTGVNLTYDCTLDGEDLKIIGSELTPIESGGTGFSVSFDENNLENSDDTTEEVLVEASFTTNKEKASGKVTFTRENEDPETIELTGTATYKDDGLTIASVSMKDSDNKFSFSCD